MGMNLYLVYLATILSASGFNTLNYIYNKKYQIKSKKRHLVFKKNLSHDTKKYSKVGDIIPSVVYLGSTILSLVPIINVCIPELSNRLYDALHIDDAIDTYYDRINDTEIVKRYSNGLTLKIMEECGYSMPDELKKEEVGSPKIELKQTIQEKLNNQIGLFYETLYPNKEKEATIDDLLMISDKEFKKREGKSLRLTMEKDVNVEMVERINQL